MSKGKRTVSFEEYQKAMEEMRAKYSSFKSDNWHIVLFFFFCVIGITLYVFGNKSITPFFNNEYRLIVSKALIPYIIIICSFYAIFFGIKFVKSLQCPKCKRFFPKGKLELFDSFQGTGMSYDSSGDAYFRPTTTSVYWTECKYCGHIIWVIKGG